MKALLCGLSVGIMLASCGGEEGSDRFRGDGMYETQREAITVFAGAMCLYEVRCLRPELTDAHIPGCIDGWIDDFCSGSFDCELPPVASDAEVDACFDVTEASECSGVGGALSMECELLLPEQSPPA